MHASIDNHDEQKHIEFEHDWLLCSAKLVCLGAPYLKVMRLGLSPTGGVWLHTCIEHQAEQVRGL